MKKLGIGLIKGITSAACMLIAVSGFCIAFASAPEEALAVSYEKLSYGADDSIEKVKGYYYKSSNKLYVSKSKNGPWKNTGLWPGSIASEKAVYGMVGKSLCEYNLKSQSFRKVVKFSKWAHLTAMYGDIAFVTHSKDVMYSTYTFAVNIKTKKIIGKYKDCEISSFEKSYATGMLHSPSDVSARPVALFRLTNSGLTKVKTFEGYLKGEGIVGGNVYYCTYKDRNTIKGTFCKYNIKSKKKKTLTTFNGIVSCEYYGSKTCKVTVNSAKRYELDLSTGRKTYIGKVEWY